MNIKYLAFIMALCGAGFLGELAAALTEGPITTKEMTAEMEGMVGIIMGRNTLTGELLVPPSDITRISDNTFKEFDTNPSLANAPKALKLMVKQARQKVEAFQKLQNLLEKHEDIMPFKKEAYAEVKTLLELLQRNISKNVYTDGEPDPEIREFLATVVYEDKEVPYNDASKTKLVNIIQDRLHTLMVYEVSKPSTADKTGPRRGDSVKIKDYLKIVDQLRKIDPTVSPLVNKPFNYGDDSVNGKTPIQLAKENGHTYCLKAMNNFLKKTEKTSKDK